MIELPHELAETLVEHARASSPREACGIVAGRDGSVSRVYSIRNAAPGVARFRLDTREYALAMRRLLSDGLRVIGFFHSHPRTRAIPSDGDTSAAYRRDTSTGERIPRHPEAAHLILSLSSPVPELRAFRFVDGEPREERVLLT